MFLSRFSRPLVRRLVLSPSVKLHPTQSSAFSSGATAEWHDKFADWAASIETDLSYNDSADQLRGLVESRLLKFTDLRDDPEKFFMAHRLMAEHSPRIGPGFWIRFTVQYNLFAGTILGLAGTEQLQILEDMHDAGELGCFALTERFAGVNSGLVVNTTAEWDSVKQEFVLNTKDGGAYKNWISQGLTADKAVVMADLLMEGKSVGPHAFVMDFRRDGKVCDGITLGDMGTKSVGNDLDNAWLQFENVKMPKSSMLNRYADIIDNRYVQMVEGIRAFDMIGQRLFTGRVAVAQAALTFRKKLFEQTKEYSDAKKCWAPVGEPVLSDIPQLKSLYETTAREAETIELFVAKCEEDLSVALTDDKMPSKELVEAIAAAKVAAVEMSIDHCFRLKQEVGSYALMHGTGFEQMDFLQCCKFAEGDSRILMQKMARDTFRDYQKDRTLPEPLSKQCEVLAAAIKSSVKSGTKQQAAWDEQWELVYKLAKTCISLQISDKK